MKYDDWHFRYRPGGWVRGTNQTGMTVFFRVAYIGDEANPRPVIKAAIMDSSERISARTWRSVPFEHLETLVEWSREAREILTLPPEAEPVAELGAYFDRTADKYDHIGGVIPTGTIVGGAESFRMVKDPGGRITDEFLENLAAMYQSMVGAGHAPGPAIAESADVPVSRVHRWVAQARKRGYLPSAIKGKAG